MRRYLTAGLALVASVEWGCSGRTPDRDPSILCEFSTIPHVPPVITPGPMIIPGVAVGPIQMGMTADELKRAIGEPDRVLGRAYDYPSMGLGVYLDTEGRVARIVGGGWCEPREPMIEAFGGYRTAKGIGVRSSAGEVRSAFGEPESIETVEPADAGLTLWCYDHEGIRFAVHDGAVVHITLSRPR